MPPQSTSVRTEGIAGDYGVLSEALLRTASLISQIQQNALKRMDISYPQYLVLNTLSDHHPKGMNLKTISAYMISPMSNTSRIIDKLIEKEMVEKIRSSADRRQLNVKLTTKGARTARKAKENVSRALNDSLCFLLGKEAELATALLTKILKQKI